MLLSLRDLPGAGDDAPPQAFSWRTLTPMGQLRLALLIGLLAGGALGCAITPTEKEAIRRAWEERDAERAAECQRAGRFWIAGGCIGLGGGA